MWKVNKEVRLFKNLDQVYLCKLFQWTYCILQLWVTTDRSSIHQANCKLAIFRNNLFLAVDITFVLAERSEFTEATNSHSWVSLGKALEVSDYKLAEENLKKNSVINDFEVTLNFQTMAFLYSSKYMNTYIQQIQDCIANSVSARAFTTIISPKANHA